MKDAIKKFGEVSRYAWIPTLVVSSCSLYYAIQNYKNQINSSRPMLYIKTADYKKDQNGSIMEFEFSNSGTKTAIRPIITFYRYDNEILKQIAIDDNLYNIAREGSTNEKFDVDFSWIKEIFLSCMYYRDDRGKNFTDNFVFKISDKQFVPGVDIFSIKGITKKEDEALGSKTQCPVRSED